MQIKKFLISFLCVFTLVLGMQTNAEANNYPNKPIKLVVAATAGGGLDILVRQMIPLLRAELNNVDIMVINKPAGNVAINEMLKARSDGYTLGTFANPAFSTNIFFSQVNYKAEDLLPISAITLTSFGLLANGKSSWNNFEDVVKTAKAENRPILVGSFNTDMRLSLESLAKATGIEFTLVPMQSGAPMIPAVMGNHIELACIPSSLADTVHTGDTKLIGSLSPLRFPNFPNSPTVTEQGFNFKQLQNTTFLTAPKGTPEEIIDILEKAIVKVVTSDAYAKILKDLSTEGPTKIGRKNAIESTKADYETAKAAKAAAK